MNILFKVRYVIVFMKEDLDNSMKEFLDQNYGHVYDVEDAIIDGVPVKGFYIEGTMRQFKQVKADMHCVFPKGQKYILFPMENEEEKHKLLKEGGWRA